MIIQCINCNKKFEVNSELIPSKGRNIQCGLCNHLWFFKKTDEYIDDITEKKSNEILSFNEKDNTSEIKDNLETLKKISKNIKKRKKRI